MKKFEQAVKDVEYYRQVMMKLIVNLQYSNIIELQEAENLRTRYNDVILDKTRLDQEVISLRRLDLRISVLEFY